MLTVTFLLDRDLGLGHPVCLPGADVSSRSGSNGPRDIRRSGRLIGAALSAVVATPSWSICAATPVGRFGFQLLALVLQSYRVRRAIGSG
jgi:hypothetical protein